VLSAAQSLTSGSIIAGSNNGRAGNRARTRATERRAASCRRVRSAIETSARGSGGSFAALSMKTLSGGAYSKTFARHNIPVTGLTATTHDSRGHYPPFRAISSCLALCLPLCGSSWPLYDLFRCYGRRYSISRLTSSVRERVARRSINAAILSDIARNQGELSDR